jgi:geranylgeranyl diphosphate synthase type II
MGVRHDVLREIEQLGFRRLHHGQIKRFKQSGGAGAEGLEVLCGTLATPSAHGFNAVFLIRKQVERGPVRPKVPRENVLLDEIDMIIQSRTGGFEKIVKDVSHCQNSWSGIYWTCITGCGANFPAEMFVPLKQGHVETSRGQTDRRCKTRDTGADDDGGLCSVSGRKHEDGTPFDYAQLLTQHSKVSSMIYTYVSANADNHGKRTAPMPLSSRIEEAVSQAIALGQGRGPVPGKLASALDYATSPGGARIRPTILLSVAMACGDDQPKVANAAAAALELIHCASLVHDDLPCFDDADMRRGKPSVHKAYSQPLAVLTGDSLIVLAFEILARQSAQAPERVAQLIMTLAQRTGMPGGICAGQGWESEAQVDLSAYHQAKTGALFIAATQMGAVAAGQEAEPWMELGARIGEAFQVADDLRDALYDADTLGKPAGQDDLHGRPNAVSMLGVEGAAQRLKDILGGAIASIPSCPGEAQLAQMVQAYAEKVTPVHQTRSNV